MLHVNVIYICVHTNTYILAAGVIGISVQAVGVGSVGDLCVCVCVNQSLFLVYFPLFKG